jgi:hypothetical protein
MINIPATHVMAGLVPATHDHPARRLGARRQLAGNEFLGGRDKPGHDDVFVK